MKKKLPTPASTENLLLLEGSYTIDDVENLYQRLPASQTSSEQYLDEVRNSPSVPHHANVLDVRLPTHLNNASFGGYSAVIQFLLTWTKRFPEGRLITYAQNTLEAKKQLPNLIAQDHGLIAVLSANDVLTVDRQTSVGEIAFETAANRLNQAFDMKVRASPVGRGISLLCVDDRPFLSKRSNIFTRDYSRHPELYNSWATLARAFKSYDDFVDLAHHLLIRPMKGDGIPPTQNIVEGFGVILYELFKNTEDWATRDLANVPIPRSIRGIRCEYVYYWKEQLMKGIENVAPLQAYINYDAYPAKSGRKLYAELSVFDSGLGLARRWLKDKFSAELSIATEYEAIYNCFGYHGSSKSGSQFGRGLHRTLQLLTELNGFLWIRTGRLSLFRNLVQNPYVGDTVPYLYDWTTNSIDPTKRCSVEGTTITILVPMESSHA